MFRCFKYNSYRILLNERLAYLRKTQKVSVTSLASSCRITRTYLSQVLNSKKHLHEDQLYRVCTELQLTKKEIDYAFVLREWEVTTVPRRKKILREKKRQMSQKEEEFKDIPISISDRYFSDPDCVVVHGLLQIKRFADHPHLIREALSLSHDRWKYIVEVLENLGAICRKNKTITVVIPPLTPPQNSPKEQCYHIAARMRVAMAKLRQTNIDDFMYNWWFAAGPDTGARLQVEILKIIREIHEEAQSEEKNGLYQLSLDLFQC
ncbi:MAG: DUF4423 domain-containing protein [Pseudobacteriovorax sp.]|nr:DUF4423 domain-containing protein [Pseudobacteriovorax sp.]